jgi:DNA-binding response OmpR family regulator
MTGLTEIEHVIHGLEAGGIGYVTKPVSPNEVVARVGVHLASARLTRGAHLALDTAGRFLVAVNRAGRVLWTTPQASVLIRGRTPLRCCRLRSEAGCARVWRVSLARVPRARRSS